MAKENINEYNLSLKKLIYPLFIREEGLSVEEVKSMPGVYKYSLASLKSLLAHLDYLGIRNILLFGLPAEKTWWGESAWENRNFIYEAISFIKSYYPGFTIFADVCLCAYTVHGHCGIIQQGQTTIDKPATLKALASIALSQAKAGADFVCPSAMADNKVQAIRKRLNQAGYSEVKIMSYSAKFASQFYGPFRQVCDSAPRFSDRRGYQLDFKSSEKAIEKIKQDIDQGADIVMVKPALAYLDIISQARSKFNVPLAAYNVSGEYAMVKLGSQAGLWPEKNFVFELIGAIQRAGADYIISYHAVDIARWQKNYGKETILQREQSAV